LSVRAASKDTQIATASKTVSPAAVLGDAPRLFACIIVMAASLEIQFDDVRPMRLYHGEEADSKFCSVLEPQRAAGPDRLMASDRAMKS
jgi:hypothetical protein